MSQPDFPISQLFSEHDPWQDNNNNIWLASTVSIARNIEKFRFPDKLSTDKKKQIVSFLSKELLGCEKLKNSRLILAEAMPVTDKEMLVAHFLSDQGFEQMHEGDAFVLDDTGRFLAIVNLQDHLLLHLLDTTEEFESAWDSLAKIEMSLNKSVNFAFSTKFGFLTADLNECGTALVVHLFLHLPALLYTGRFDEVMKNCLEDGVEYTGLQGDPTELIGDVVAFRNAFTLGVKEEDILSSLRSLVTKVIVEENAVRLRLKQGQEPELAHVKDKVSRAYAILLHSYQIEAIEALESLSLLKLGLDLGWIEGTTQQLLNRLFFATRRAHLLSDGERKIPLEELPHRRSEFVHQALQAIKLLI